MYEKVYVSPRPPPKISFKDNWMKEFDSEIAGSSKDTQRIQPKPKTQLSRTGRPVGGFKSIQSCVSMPIKIEAEDQTRTERPVGGQESTKVEELDTDFRVPGLSHRTFPSSRARQKDRKSSSSRSTSSRLAAEQHLQPIQQQFEGDDLGIGQCRVIRVVQNYTKSTMFSLSSLLESRNCALHLRLILG